MIPVDLKAVATLVYWEVLILLGGIFGIVFWMLLTRRIRLNGLFKGDQPGGGTHFSPGRVQLFTFTILFAVYYLGQVIRSPGEFPPVSNTWLSVLGGSGGVYLAGKAQALLFPDFSGRAKGGVHGKRGHETRGKVG